MDAKNNRGRVFSLLTGVIIGLVLALLVLVILCAVFFYKGSNKPIEEPTDAVATGSVTEPGADVTQPTDEPTADPQEDMAVVTPFCTLYYPGKWNDSIRTEQLDLGYGHAVHFYGSSCGRETELFSVLFGFDTEASTCIGTVMQNGISTDVNVEITAFAADDSWDADAVREITAMQKDADYLIDKLKKDSYFQLPETEEENVVPDVSDAVLQTPYCTLYYPGQWKDAVSWDITSDDDICTVAFKENFSGKNVTVFTLSFNNPEDTGFQMGTLNHKGREIAVCLTLCDFPQNENWDDAERNLFLTLQEQAFNMLEKLAADSHYTSILSME